MNLRWVMKQSVLLAALLAALVPGAMPLAAEEVKFTPEEQAVLGKAQEFSRAFEIVAEKVRPAVVSIQAERPDIPVTQGAGVIVDERGFILTNSHVVHAATTITVRLTDGREFPAELVGDSQESDIAVIRIQAPNLTVAKMGDSDLCKVGSWILAIGNPFGLESSVTSGIISAKGRSNVVKLEIADFIQTDAPINPGNSGGPLVNLQGEVIGVTTATNRGSEGLSFAIPANLARTIMNGIISHRRATTSYLGVVFQPVTSKIADAFGLPAAHGALVAKVLAGTPAEKAGLQAGDVIVKYGKREVQDDNQLRTFVATTSPGETVAVEFFRQGARQTGEVKVEALPEEVVIARRSQKLLEDLGVLQLATLTPELIARLGYEKDARGVLIITIKRGSPACEFLAPGALILRINEQEVNTPDDILKALGGAAEGTANIFWRFGEYYGSRRIVFK